MYFIWVRPTMSCVQLGLFHRTWQREGDPWSIFRFQSGVPLSRDCLVKRARQALAPSGLDMVQYSGHSFRIGAAASVGIEDLLTKTLSRWESNAYQIYVKVPRDNLAAVSKCLVCLVHT